MKRKEKTPDADDLLPEDKDKLPEKHDKKTSDPDLTPDDKENLPEKEEKKSGDVDESKESDKLDESSLEDRKVGDLVKSASELSNFVAEHGIRSDLNLDFVISMTQGRRDLIEGILLSTKEVVEGKNLSQLVQHLNIPSVPSAGSLSNYQVRIWYKYTKGNISNVIDKTKSLEVQAKQAFDLRNTYRTNARIYMKDKKLAKYLQEVEKNEVWENFVKTTSTKTGKSGDDLWKEIIDKSMHGRERVDELFKLDNL